jgi:hypothetical protein
MFYYIIICKLKKKKIIFLLYYNLFNLLIKKTIKRYSFISFNIEEFRL